MDKKGIRTFRDLRIWQLAREITREVYELTKRPAFRRDFRLASQAQSSAVSAQTNIAEGFERDGNREFHNFLSISKGSCGELETHLVVAMDQHYISEEEEQAMAQRIQRLSRMIGKLMQRLKACPHRGRKFKKCPPETRNP